MSETPHLGTQPGDPAETRQSGSDGERKGGGADERVAPQKVSRETSGPEKNKRSSVYVYLAVLFGAAFFMLLLAYFVQQRNNETTISGLQNSWDLSREELMEENQRLEEEKSALAAQVAELEGELELERNASYEFQVAYDGSRNAASHLKYYLLQRTQAMDLFWQLDRSYAQGRNAQCRQLIEWLETPEAEPLKNYLPNSDDRGQYDYGLDGPSPAERYQEIYNQLS